MGCREGLRPRSSSNLCCQPLRSFPPFISLPLSRRTQRTTSNSKTLQVMLERPMSTREKGTMGMVCFSQFRLLHPSLPLGAPCYDRPRPQHSAVSESDPGMTISPQWTFGLRRRVFCSKILGERLCFSTSLLQHHGLLVQRLAPMGTTRDHSDTCKASAGRGTMGWVGEWKDRPTSWDIWKKQRCVPSRL